MMTEASWWDSTSICSGRVPITYFWHALAAEAPAEQHVTNTVAALMGAIRDGKSRVWHQFTLATAEGEFRSRLRRALDGHLEPPDEIKRIRQSHPAKLYEIRWQHIHVVERGANGPGPRHDVSVRLLEGEPESLTLTAIGLRVHEKTVEDESRHTQALQDDEINAACETYWKIMAQHKFVPNRRVSTVDHSDDTV